MARKIRRTPKTLRFWRLFIFLFLFAFLCKDIITVIPQFAPSNSPISVLPVCGPNLANVGENYTHIGAGAPWNVTHWANRTDTGQVITFTNGTSGMAGIPLGLGWEGSQLNASIGDLTDVRNWINGTFNFGADDGINATPADDSTDPRISANTFQNWSFGSNDKTTSYQNNMSGNYFDGMNPGTDGLNCLELKINASYQSGGFSVYENGDKCWWNSSFTINQTQVLNSELQFDLKLMRVPVLPFDFLVLLNGETVYTNNIEGLKQICGEGSWGKITLPQWYWSNSSDIFTSPAFNSPVSINFTLVSTLDMNYYPAWYSDYDQILIANPRLILKCEATPSQVQLAMNATCIEDTGKVSVEGAWTGTQVWASFNSIETQPGVIFNSSLFNLYDQSSKIAFTTDLTLSATKEFPDTNYEMDVNTPGVKFSATNGSYVDWEAFVYFAVPTGYEETEMRMQYPKDVNMTWISEPQNNDINLSESCIIDSSGSNNEMIVPVRAITNTPDGFWHLMAVSPNYCNQLSIFKNSTIIPTDSGWDLNYTFVSGDYVNITGGIFNASSLFPNIGTTGSTLAIQFPNGTLWVTHEQNVIYDQGTVTFNYFQIPSAPPEYEEGTYVAILEWYNSQSPGGCNATGVITRTFLVMHRSQLFPEQPVYSGVFENSTFNLKVSFNDFVDNHAIRDALVYLVNFTGGIEYFTEISPGYYLLEFNTTGGLIGDNNITIHANSSLYLSSVVNITIILRSLIFHLRLEETPEPPAILDLQVVQAFQVQFVVPEDADLMQSVVLQYWFDSESGVHVVEMNKTSASTYTVNLVEFPADATLLEYTAIGTDMNGKEVPFGRTRSIQLLPAMPVWSMAPMDLLMAFAIALAAGIMCSRIYHLTARDPSKRDPGELTSTKPSSASGFGLALIIVSGTTASAIIAFFIFEMAEVAMLLITGAFLSTTFLWVLALNARVIKSFKEKTPKLSGLPVVYLIGFGILAEILVLLWMGDAVPWWRVRVNQNSFSILGITIPQIVTTILSAFFTSILLLTRSIRVDVKKTVADFVEAEKLNENPDRIATNSITEISRILSSVALKGVVFLGLIGMTIVLSSNLAVYAGQGLVIIGAFAVALLIPGLARRLWKVIKGPPMQVSVSDHVVACATCGKDTATSGTYCENCGGKLITGTRTKQIVYCTQCQRPNPTGAGFCRFCGTQFQEKTNQGATRYE